VAISRNSAIILTKYYSSN